MFRRHRGRGPRSIYSFLITWLICAMFLPLYRLSGLLLTLGAGVLIAYLVGKASGKEASRKDASAEAEPARKTVDTSVRKIGEQKASDAAPEKKSYRPLHHRGAVP